MTGERKVLGWRKREGGGEGEREREGGEREREAKVKDHTKPWCENVSDTHNTTPAK